MIIESKCVCNDGQETAGWAWLGVWRSVGTTNSQHTIRSMSEVVPGPSSELELDSPSSSVNSKALMWGRELTLGQYENKMYNKFSFYSIIVQIFHRCFELHLLHLDDERRA